MNSTITSAEIARYLDEYKGALIRFDADAAAALWGMPGTILTDDFCGSIGSHADMAAGLRKTYPTYQALGLTDVGYQILARISLTSRIVQLHVRWFFRDSYGEVLSDTDYVYILRKDSDRLQMYIAIGINDREKLEELLARKNMTFLPGTE